MRKIKIYRIEYGNGFAGSRANLGSEYVIAASVGAARVALAANKKIPLSRIGRACVASNSVIVALDGVLDRSN
jgi:hypothetical protein